jgi:hypothetical protein
MFIAHFGVAFAAKKAVPEASLGTLILAAQFVDLLWPMFLLAGVEHVRIDPGNTAVTPLDFYDYPISHSFLMSVGWSVVVGGLYFLFRKNMKGAALLALVVLSHWFLDLLTHRPDLPLFPGSGIVLGLGLWNSPFWTVAAELAIFSTGIWLYLRAKGGPVFSGKQGFWGVVAFLAVVWFLNILGPPPPNETAIGIAGLALWLLVPLGHLVDRAKPMASS